MAKSLLLCPLDYEYLWRALRYIEQNPVRAGLVSTAEDYPWSSARAHLGGIDETHMLDLSRWSALWTPMEWQYITMPVEPIETQQIRQATQAGTESVACQAGGARGRLSLV